MSEIIEAPGDYPADIEQRRRLREWAGLAAAAFAIILVGIVLAVVFRDDDPGEQFVAPGPAATPTAAPSPAATEAPATTETPIATATIATAVPSPTATVPPAGSIVENIPVGVGPGEMAAGAGSIWVVNTFDGTLSRIDPASNEVVATIPIGSPATDDLVIFVRANGDRVWVLNLVDETLLQIDPATNQVAQTLPRPNIPGGGTLPYGVFAVASDGALWITYELNNLIARVDPQTGEITATLEVDDPGVATGSDAVWAITERELLRLDPATAEVVTTIELDATPRRLAVTDDAVWLGLWGSIRWRDRSTGLGSRGRLDTQSEIVARIPLGDITPFPAWIESIAVGDGAVWVILDDSEVVVRIDRASNSVVRIEPAP